MLRFLRLIVIGGSALTLLGCSKPLDQLLSALTTQSVPKRVVAHNRCDQAQCSNRRGSLAKEQLHLAAAHSRDAEDPREERVDGPLAALPILFEASEMSDTR